MNAIDKINKAADENGFVFVVLMPENIIPITKEKPRKNLIELNIHKDLASYLYRNNIAVYGFTDGCVTIETTSYENEKDNLLKTEKRNVFSLFKLIERDLPNLRGLRQQL